MASHNSSRWKAWLLVLPFVLYGVHRFAGFATARQLTVAVLAPLSGPKAFMGVPLKEGVQLAIDEINERGGIQGRKVKLLVVDDGNDPQLAERRARELGGDGRTLIVLGHRTTETCLQAGKVYAQAGLPAITASASAPEVTAGNPWYFRIVTGTDYQGRFLAHYAQQVLGWQSVRLVADDSAYGQSLSRSFKEASGPLGVRIDGEWTVPSAGDDLKARLFAAGKEIAATSTKSPLLLAVGEAVAVQLLIALRDAGEHTAALSGQILGNQAFAEHFKDRPAEQRQPGFYTDGLIATSVALVDTASEAAQRYYRRYRTVYHGEPDALSAAYYDAAVLALQGLEETRATGSDVARERRRMRDWLSQLSSPQTAFIGTTGRIFFDASHSAVKTVPVGRFDGGRFVAAPIQLDLIARPESVPNFEAEREAGNIVSLGGLYWSKVQVVYVGVDVLSISDINQRSHEFTADLFVWFRYQGNSPVEDLEFPNATNPISLSKPVWTRQRDNLTVATYRTSGTFKANFEYANYPLDHQILPIRLRHGRKTVSTLILATDSRGMALKDRSFEALALSKLTASFSGSTWRPHSVLFYQSNFKSDSTLGENGLAYADTGLEYSQISADIEVRRNVASYFTKNTLPLILILLLLYMANFVAPEQIETRANMGITALLTSIVLYQSMSSEIATIGYLTLMDYVYYMAFALCILEVSGSILGFLAIREGRQRVLRFVRLAGFLVTPATMVLTAIGIYVWYRMLGR